MSINWSLFAGSSHCAEGLAMFARGDLKTFAAFEQYFLPHMKEQATEVRKMRGKGIARVRAACARAFKRHEGQSVADAYGNAQGSIFA